MFVSSDIFFYLGFLIVFYYFMKCLKFLFHLLFWRGPNLKSRYFDLNSWAVITGASDGIGKEFAIKLASLGFNIVLMARNKDKTSRVAQEIRDLYPSISVDCIICDFCQCGSDNFSKHIISELQKYQDIAILINNVGTGLNGFFMDSPLEELRDLINVNCMSITIMTKLLIPRFLIRPKHSLIINLSSFTRVNPLPLVSIYGASKAFDDYFSRVLDLEFSPKLDIISFSPLFVSTLMIGFRQNLGAISTKEAVEGVLNEIGYGNHTYGHWKHQILGNILGVLLSFQGVVKWGLRQEWLQKKLKKEFSKIKLIEKAQKQN